MATPKKSAKSAKSTKSAASDKAADKPVHVAPVVNLTQAAQSAAMLLAARRKRAEAEADVSNDHVNAAAFKQMKAGLNQPQFSTGSPLSSLNKPAKPTGSPGFMRQQGQNQAGGANVARTGVPRRTSGG